MEVDIYCPLKPDYSVPQTAKSRLLCPWVIVS